MSHNPSGLFPPPSGQSVPPGPGSDNPPPVPPRTWMNYLDTSITRPQMQHPHAVMTLPYGGRLDGFQPASGSQVHMRSSQSFTHHNTAWNQPTSDVNMQQYNPHLINLSPSGERLPYKTCSSFNDLEGLDFSMTTAVTSAPAETTKPDVPPATGPKMYPDISGAFKELSSMKTQTATQPQTQAWTTGFPAAAASSTTAKASQRHSMPSYGWDPAVAGMIPGGLAAPGSTSVPTTPVQGPFYPQGINPSLMGYNIGASVPTQQASNIYPGFVGGTNFARNSASFAPTTMTGPFHQVAGDSVDSSQSANNGGFNLVPNLDFDSWPEAMETTSSNSAVGDGTFRKTHQRKTSDLIELGFEGILTPDEKEYFSLEYFDPLHRKGRTASISSSHSSSHYFFAKPPEESVVSKDRDAWVTFDDDLFKTSGEEGMKDDEANKPVHSSGKHRDEPSISQDDTKGHEKLRKKLVVDEESDAFCQMVAELKSKYKSTDEKMNLGFIVSPLCDKQQDAMTVKIVVHSTYASEPISFTCDVHSLVEHVIEQVLCGLTLPSHMIKVLKSPDFILKVNDRSEYLLNEYPLSKYSYTHDCLKMDVDLCFCVMRRQDVALPFLRTIDDDNQQLYFPQEQVKDSDVTRESLDILMNTFYKEVEKITDHVLKDELDVVKFQSLSQSVKAICNMLSKIETVSIAKCLQRVDSLLNQLKASLHQRSSTLEHTDGGYATIQRRSVKVSKIPELEEALESLVNAVKGLVRIYCQAFHTDFHLGTKMDQPWDSFEDLAVYNYPQDVMGYNENFIVQICTIHRIPLEWGSRFDEYKVECSLFHGIRHLSTHVSTTCASVCTTGLVPVIIWDEWLSFDEIHLSALPRESRLCVTLVGVKNLPTANANPSECQKEETALGGVTIQLFNRRGYILQGSQLVPFQMNAPADPVTPFCSTLQPDSALLQFNLPDFGKQIVFSEPLRGQDGKKKTIKDLIPDIQEKIKEVLKLDCVSSCSADQLAVLWTYRHNLHDQPRLLPWILQAAQQWDWSSLPQIYSLLRTWTALQPMQSLELLLPQYPDMKVREFAVDCLRKMPTDDLIDFIPQLIQALKYESYHSSPLAQLLLEQSCKSVRFAHQFFWLLKGATQDALYKRRYELMFVALVSVAGEALYQEFHKQEEIVKVLTVTAERVQQAKGADKEATLKKYLDELYDIFQQKRRVLLPHNPGYEVAGIELNSCSFFTSNAFPLKLVFKNFTENAGPVYAMFKVGDDLRQDMMTMQIVRIMDRLWLKEGLDLKMISFSCLPTGPKRGFIEIITESETLRKIQVSSGVTGSFKDRPIKDWLQKHNPTELDYQKAVGNFTRSCAGYCVVTYVLGVCDRHNDNIMLKQTGHLFHIDFNKILGDSQMFGNIKRDRVKFVLTSDMAYVINDGDRQSDKFQHFIDMCVQAFNILRKHANLFINLFTLMLRSGVPGITEKGVEFVRRALLPGCTDTQAAAEFTRMIQDSLSAKSTQINFFIHNLAQMKFSSHSEGALLSFVPKVYNHQTDGKIKHIEVHGFEKRYSPEKHYIYTLKVERVNQKVSTLIFRLFSEFVEFRTKLAAVYPLVAWPQLQGRVLGRSHVKTVAENRKADIERFLQELWKASPEISHSELVYTFFHPLLRDEQEAQRERLPKLRVADRKSSSGKINSKLSPNSPENPLLIQTKPGQVKLSLEYHKDTLQVMVMHAKDLPVRGSELPSPYVKMYLLPDPEKYTKRKTKVIKDTTHPTYNELIEYKFSMESLRLKILQVTIWDHDVLNSNDLLGAVYIRLRDLDLSQSISNWFMLDKIQMTDANL